LTRKEKGASVTVEVASGVVAVDGTPDVLVSADYPYYRDDPGVWADRLRSLRDELRIGVVSAYVPWRHHQPDADRAPDFTGAGDPSGAFVSASGGIGFRTGVTLVPLDSTNFLLFGGTKNGGGSPGLKNDLWQGTLACNGPATGACTTQVTGIEAASPLVRTIRKERSWHVADIPVAV